MPGETDWRDAALLSCVLCGRAEGSRVHVIEKIRSGILPSTVGYRRVAICESCLAGAPVAVGRKVRECWDVLPRAGRGTARLREPRAELSERDASCWRFIVFAVLVHWQD